MRFADSAARLAGLAGWLLGWSPDRFWAATPDELAAIFGAMTAAEGRQAAPPDGETFARLKEMFPDG